MLSVEYPVPVPAPSACRFSHYKSLDTTYASSAETSESVLASGLVSEGLSSLLPEATIRALLKVVRDPTKTAYELLPTGETVGEFANRHAVERYARKVESKRERARVSRRKKRKSADEQGGPPVKKTCS